MSVEAATLKRIAFLTSRWDYDIPHKHVWVVDMYGVTKNAIDKLLNSFDRRDIDKDFPVYPEVTMEAVRTPFGYNMLAQKVSYPDEQFSVSLGSFNNSGGIIHGYIGGERRQYGEANTLDIDFLQTNTDIVDYFIKPWLIAASHKGLIEDGDNTTNIKATVEAYMFARDPARDFKPELRKHITFHGVVPVSTETPELDYSDMKYDQIVDKVKFVFRNYTINNIRATTPIAAPIRPQEPLQPPADSKAVIITPEK